MPEQEINAAIRFLREKGILAEDKTQWIVRFSGGNELDIVDLFKEFASKEIDWDRENIKRNVRVHMDYEQPVGKVYRIGKDDRYYSVDLDSIDKTPKTF